MFRRNKFHFTAKVQENDDKDELPFMITIYLEGNPCCDVVFNVVLNRYVFDPSIMDIWCPYTTKFITRRLKEHFKEFIDAYDPIILENDRGHYESKEFTAFLPNDQKCPSCAGMKKRYYGSWEYADDHTYLATCKTCGGSGLKVGETS